MGYRLSLFKTPRTAINKCRKCTEYTEVLSIINPVSKRLVYDFCTDAMINNTAVSRITDAKLPAECDITLGYMTKNQFMKFSFLVLEKAKTQLSRSNGYSLSWNWMPSNDPHLLSDSTDWIGAYFTCLYLLKTIDWNRYHVYFEIS